LASPRSQRRENEEEETGHKSLTEALALALALALSPSPLSPSPSCEVSPAAKELHRNMDEVQDLCDQLGIPAASSFLEQPKSAWVGVKRQLGARSAGGVHGH
jgi:hypothetical protein